jgi:hypothetical protein
MSALRFIQGPRIDLHINVSQLPMATSRLTISNQSSLPRIGGFLMAVEYFPNARNILTSLRLRWKHTRYSRLCADDGADADTYTQKAPCENTFRAITNALAASKGCDVTGIVAIACARHGCYAPNAMVDLFRSEQQKNVDFAVLRSLDTTGVDPDQGFMLMYDIVCQYFIYLAKRIGSHLPDGLEIDRAIGMFHVHAHKEQCFFRFAPSLIPGAGVCAGEILESLWSGLNGISPSTRTATLAHRAEVLDDHACDSNHKKLLGMTTSLMQRHIEATETLEVSDRYLAQQTQSADPMAIQHWRNEIEAAEETRLTNPPVMDIYGARVIPRNAAAAPTPSAATPTAESAARSATEIWLQFALVIQEKQSVIFLTDTLLSKLGWCTELIFDNVFASWVVTLGVMIVKK